MKRNIFLPLVFSLFLVLISAYGNQLQAQPVKATVITVNDVGDSVDAAPDDGICADAAGRCTLRAAIAESNARIGTDVIIFDVPVPAVITLTLGELKTTDSVSILGRGARRLTIQRRNSNDTSNFRVFNLTAPTQLRGLTIRNGNSSTSGGGILSSAGLRLYDVMITGNNARSGGGIALQGSEAGSSIIERCLITANTSSQQGGGIYIAPGMYPSVKSSSLTNNSAVAGGAIANYGEPVLVNNTIARNSASQGSSSVLNGSGSYTKVINTIIGPDTGQTVSSVGGQFFSLGSNIVTNTTGSSGWSSDDQVSTNNGIDPMLGKLSDNGGQTDMMAVLQGSPAINMGDDCVISIGCGGFPFIDVPTRDQRKFPRIAGAHVDVGAYESSASLSTNTFMVSLFFGQTHRIAYSRVTVINTETLEKRTSFIALRDQLQGLSGGIPPMSFQHNNVYVAEVHTKRSAIFSPSIFDF
ncbi:MAG: choice-of-anchor Q domain-containing protein [Pyrinomonadaceae bacterium]